MAELKVTLIKSTIGASPAQKKVVEALGLRKLHHFNIMPDNPQTRGALDKVKHMLKVEEL